MNLVVVLDTETTGLDLSVDELAEVAWALWDPELRTMISAESHIVRGETGRRPPELTGIPPEAGTRWGISRDEALAKLRGAVAGCSAIVAHNADFDRSFLPGLAPRPRWACSMEQISWPRRANSASLVSLALAHGVGVTTAHRALSDVLLLVRLMERACELGWDPVSELTRACRPSAIYQGLQAFDRNDQAKAAGFRWNGQMWRRRMFKDMVHLLPFRVREVPESEVP